MRCCLSRGRRRKHDFEDLDMAGGVDVGEVGVGFVEEKREIGSGEDDGVQTVHVSSPAICAPAADMRWMMRAR